MLKKKLSSTLLALVALSSLASCKKASTSGSVSTNPTSGTSASAGDSAEAVTGFNGLADLTGITFDEKADILGQMEAYAIKNHISGIPLYGDGGYSLLSTRIKLGATKYINNYGFGILREGKILSSMTAAQEPNAEFVDYYHTETADSKDLISPYNADDTGVSTQAGYISSSLWANRLIKNKDTAKTYKDDYEWYGQLAQEDEPTPVNLNEETGSATKWRFKVRTGANSGLKFRTASTKTIDGKKLSDFDGRDVTINDYLFALKVLATQSYGNYYYFQFGSDTAEIVGVADYNEATEKVGCTDEDAKKAWANVGYKAVDDETIEVEFKYPCNAFNAMYRLSGTLLSPLNEEFYTLVTTQSATGTLDSKDFHPEVFGSYNSDKSLTPADTILSLGAYTLKTYDTGTGSDNQIVFQRNDDWFEIAKEKKETGYDIYRIPGIKISINTAAQTSQTAIYEDFKAGKCDASGIPSSAAAAEAGEKPYKYKTEGSSVWKLQCNTFTQEEWNAAFGVDGYVNQDYRTEDPAAYYQCKPIMSNDNFINGVWASINREELATAQGADIGDSFFSDAYEIDPVKHTIYNDTEAHKKAVKDFFPNTHGYNLEAAKTLFSTAIDQELAAGHYTAGTKEQPTEIHVEIAYMYQWQVEDEGNTVKGYIENAFNAVALDKGVKLVCDVIAGTNWYDVYYSKTLIGQFDFAFASISGGTLDPFNFMNTLCSDSRSTFTLSWGVDTSKNDGSIVFKGHSYSYDAIYDAVTFGDRELVNGEEVR
jgi:ABC-type oligopeptide transport system substrate-binding subunit